MAESGHDEKAPVKGLLGRSLSRRRFLGVGAAAVGAALAKWKMSSLDAQLAAAALRASRKVEASKAEPKKESPRNDFEEKFFHNLTSDEKGTVDEKIERMKGNFDDHIGRCERNSQDESEIIQATQRYEIPRELLIGLIFAESGGDRVAVSEDAKAKGLTQVMDSMAESWAQDRIFNYTNDENDDRYNVPRVLEYSCREIAGYFEKFGDWGLAFWAWHAGEPRVFEALRVYFKGELPSINVLEGNTPEEKEEAFKKAMEVRKLYKKKIRESGVCVHHLLSTPEVREIFKGEEWDKTDEYCYRIAAGAGIYFGR